MNPQSLGHVPGYSDTQSQAEQYIRSYLRKVSKEDDYNEVLVSAYLKSGLEMVNFLESHSAARFIPCPTPDYYSELEGAVKAGRTILNAPYDGRRLGSKLVKQVRYPLQGYSAFGSLQVRRT